MNANVAPKVSIKILSYAIAMYDFPPTDANQVSSQKAVCLAVFVRQSGCFCTSVWLFLYVSLAVFSVSEQLFLCVGPVVSCRLCALVFLLFCGRSLTKEPRSPSPFFQLALRRGDRLAIVSKAGDDRGWWKGQVQMQGASKKIGYFPKKYVKELREDSSCSFALPNISQA